MFTAKTVYAQVAFERAIDKVFDYIVPSELVDKLVPGSIVRAPFGDKVLDGIVAALVDTPSVDNLKKIDAVSEETILHETKLFELAQWISAYYLCPLGLTLKAMYPSYVRRKKTEQETVYVSLTMNREDTVRMIDRLSQSARRQADVLSWLLTAREPMIDKQRVIKNAHADMRVLQGLEKKGAISLISETQITCQENNSSRYKFVDSISSVQLSPSQSAVMEKICSALSEPTFTPFVLHGVTGSGKTEVYIRAIQEVLKNGREAIMLIPEISLTPQTEESFRKRFGDQVAVFHSRLSDGQRAGEWKKMRDGAVKLVVGARSALFAPFKNLGIIIVDEEHERSYKQGETPRYNARDVAIVRAKMEGI
ncbi:DEAD/DEAH box helicase family protein, partial [bacterium]|nr:DEAD/DEAH box helicase family protein [bacterium]